MRREYNLTKPCMSFENIATVDVIRDRGYRHSYVGGRIRHGIIYVERGSIRYDFLDEYESCLLCAGEMFFVPKDCRYVGTYGEDGTNLKILNFDFTAAHPPAYLQEPQRLDVPEAAEIIRGLFLPSVSGGADHEFYYLSRMYEFLWLMEQRYSRLPKKYRRLQPALSDITERYYVGEKTEYYAALCDMSEVSFRRLFKEYTGLSPIDYRNGIRLDRARANLQSGEYNVSEAALAVGFSNLSFFIRLYKKRYGYTPKKE